MGRQRPRPSRNVHVDGLGTEAQAEAPAPEVDEAQRVLDLEDAAVRLTAIRRALARRDETRTIYRHAALSARQAKRRLAEAEMAFAEVIARERRRK
jgi:hypothetical protein